jgi:putative chitinase
MRIFGGYFAGNLAESYAHQPEKIASRVYGSRMGNGDETTKEGWKYRGAGYIQLTGKDNYRKFGEFIGVDLVSNPELVATKYPLTSAAYFFNSNNLWIICDEGSTDDIVTKVTRRVNGGTNGLSHRLQEFKKFISLLS